ncbi:snRNA-activating protein complex subunit 4-like protein [Frankliniella fusca]|uniref:snRNA-activating protein complex subunit 4-like protein n=1 Tax=Frankliniella fusca TaxID=407009 RepID=A0AAE1GXF3_9NEOP|nr:snRNA-activating protein complex subunit 4-like protein [Frankliniella fusca]
MSRKRVREARARIFDEDLPNKQARGEFTDIEDTQLLSALLQHGPLDMVKLREAIPTRNDYQIKQRLSVLQKKAQQSLITVRKECENGTVKYEPREKVALDKWIDHLLELQDKAQIESGFQEELPVRMLAWVFGLIAKYEDHPDPKECGGVNLENVYEFLEKMMMGLPSKDLRNPDARFLIQGLQRLSSLLASEEVEGEKGFIMCGKTQWRSKGQRPRTYSKVAENNSSDLSDEILQYLDTDKCNPFKIPVDKLKKVMNLDVDLS